MPPSAPANGAKKSIMLTNAAEHITACLKIKKDKANRKKAAREARERAKEQAQREEERRLAEEQGIILGDGESGDDGDEEKGAGKSTKKVAGKKAEGDMKGKKRKADGEADKGPKQKKKKDEPKPKTKPKGESCAINLIIAKWQEIILVPIPTTNFLYLHRLQFYHRCFTLARGFPPRIHSQSP